MKNFFLPLLLLLTGLAHAQDKVTLSNGDVLTGVVKNMADGKLTVTSPVIGDVVVPLANVTNITTAAPVRLLTGQGEMLNRKILGIESGQLRLDNGADGAPNVTSLALTDLGQINPPENPPAHWTGSVKLHAGTVSGNTQRRSIGSSFEAIRRTEIDRITVDGLWDYAQDQESGVWTLTERRAGAGLKYDYFISKKWYALANTRALGDTLADLRLRYSAGAGIGYQVIDTDKTSLLTEVGLSYFNESYLSGTPSTDYLAARLAYKLNYQLSKTQRLLHSVEAFPSTERATDVNFTMNTELQTNLTDSMIASLAWVWDYDNTPAIGRKRSDHRVLLSIGWTF
jgi:putative salt-induced outer membrane protein YdiY